MTTPALGFSPDAATAGVHAANTAPKVAKPITVNNGPAITGKTASLSVLGSDDGGESKLVYVWSVTSVPSGGSATFSVNNTNAAKNSTATFTAAGTYTLSAKIADAAGLSVTTNKSAVVSATLTSIRIATPAGIAVTAGSPLTVASTSQTLNAQAMDQFGKSLATQPTFTWTTATLPTGATAPVWTRSGSSGTATFGQAGTYTLITGVSGHTSPTFTTTVAVAQTLSSITVSPNTASVACGATQQFAAQGFDQFRKAMATPPIFTWSTTAGTISTGGLFTAPASGTSSKVTAAVGTVTGTASVTLTTGGGSSTLKNAQLASLVTSLDSDGSINRLDMIQILRSTGNDGTVDATELADLKQILSQSASLAIPGYVQTLAGNVVNGNTANAKFQGNSLGNLAAGSSATQLNRLVDKWFLGTDHPTLTSTSLVYRQTSGTLFPHTPTHLDEVQGALGDCYLISALGTLADSNPAAVQNMFLDNGDGTYTVRFYTGTYGSIYNYTDGTFSDGFSGGPITADYVTVDSMLPANSAGYLVYANYGVSVTNTANALWIPLAEKAYAQWNETGKEGRDGKNAYASIEGGWMATADAQVLGRNATDYTMSNSTKVSAINALAGHKAVTIGTNSFSGTNNGLYGSHAYAIIAYSASTDRFTLYNPWGSDHPGPLSWSHLQSTCSSFVVADTSASQAFAAAGASSTNSAPTARSLGAANAMSRVLYASLVDEVLRGRESA